jgi:hypothetical protein
MMNNPLDRRMFNQQMPNQPSMGRQPMGILNSSPQLINAVQGYAQGGMVKGYNHGGAHYIPGQTSNQDIMQKLDRLNKAEFQPELPLNQTLNEPGMITSLDDVTKIKVEPSTGISNIDTSNAEEVNSFNTDTPVEVDEFGKSDVTTQDQGINKYNMGESSTINEENAKILAKQKKVVDEEDNGVPPVNPYKNLDTKYATKLKNASAAFDKATNDPKVTAKWAKKVEEVYNRKDSIDLEKIDKLAKEAAGIEGNDYDKDRSTAFWMGMIKGGLATAAGESSNALTNIAKGLGFGVESYGKDINAINENEREDRKEYGKIKVDLIKNEESKLLAHKTLDLQYAANMTSLEQNASQFESRMAFDVAKQKIDVEMGFENIEIAKASAWNQMNHQSKIYNLQVKAFKLDKVKQADYVRLTTQQLKDAWDKSLITDDMKEVISLRPEYINVNKETGRFESFTDLGQKALVTSKITALKVTDLNTVADGHVKLGNVLGVKFLDSNGKVDVGKTKAAGLVWQENFADKWQKIQVNKSSGAPDPAGQKAEEQRILKEFANLSGGIYTAPVVVPTGSSIKSIKKLN